MSDIKTIHHFDAKENKDIIERVQDCEPILKEAALLRAQTDGRSDTALGTFVGTIPGIVIEAYEKEVGITHHEFMIDRTHIHRIMDNPDFKKFRVWEGKLGKAK